MPCAAQPASRNGDHVKGGTPSTSIEFRFQPRCVCSVKIWAASSGEVRFADGVAHGRCCLHPNTSDSSKGSVGLVTLYPI